MKGGKIPFLTFLLLCTDQILHEHSISYAALKLCELEPRNNLGKNRHCLVPIPPTEKKKRPQKKCVVENKIRKDSRKMCIGCPGNPAFCTIEHFTAKHK